MQHDPWLLVRAKQGCDWSWKPTWKGKANVPETNIANSKTTFRHHMFNFGLQVTLEAFVPRDLLRSHSEGKQNESSKDWFHLTHFIFSEHFPLTAFSLTTLFLSTFSSLTLSLPFSSFFPFCSSVFRGARGRAWVVTFLELLAEANGSMSSQKTSSASCHGNSKGLSTSGHFRYHDVSWCMAQFQKTSDVLFMSFGFFENNMSGRGMVQRCSKGCSSYKWVWGWSLDVTSICSNYSARLLGSSDPGKWPDPKDCSHNQYYWVTTGTLRCFKLW